MQRHLLVTGQTVTAVLITVAAGRGLAGELNPPPGPVAATHKTLTEVEPRIPVGPNTTPGDADALLKITQPGSYYLTGNVTGASGRHGIEIAADGVTLNLSGFAVMGVAGSLNGIHMPAFGECVVIRNGTVSQWGGHGISARIDNGAIENVHARANAGWGIQNFVITASVRITGCSAVSNGAGVQLTGGIFAGVSATVESCHARINTGDGIVANGGSTLYGNTATFNTGRGISAGIGSTVNGNTATSNGGDGIRANTGSTVSVNTAQANGDDGIGVGPGSTVTGNTAQGNTGDGIQCSSNCLILRNNCSGNGENGTGHGIHATAGGNRVEGNTVADNDFGIAVVNATATGNLIVGNSASGNAGNYSIVAGNSFGQVVDVSGAIITSNNPWANLQY